MPSVRPEHMQGPFSWQPAETKKQLVLGLAFAVEVLVQYVWMLCPGIRARGDRMWALDGVEGSRRLLGKADWALGSHVGRRNGGTE